MAIHKFSPASSYIPRIRDEERPSGSSGSEDKSENLVRDLEPEVIYEDLYMNIDDWGKENATIYTKDEWLK